MLFVYSKDKQGFWPSEDSVYVLYDKKGNMTKAILHKVYYFVIPLLIAGISLQLTSFSIAFIALIPLFLKTNRHTLGLFFLMYGGSLGGVVRSMYPSIPVYGILLELIGLLLIWDLVLDLFHRHSRVLLSMLFILLFFGVFYMIGPRDSFATNKYINICIHGVLMLFGYYAFDNSNKINVEDLTRILLIASICMFTYVISATSMTPGGFFDYNWFREQSTEIVRTYSGERLTVVGYQQIGMLILFATVIFLSQIHLNKWKSLFYVICASELVLVSGSRQAILGVVLAVVLRLLLFRYYNYKKGNVGTRILWLSISLVAAYFAISFIFINVGSNAMSRTIQEGDSGREMLWMIALDIFRDSPLLGVGLGGYHAITGEAYPHNYALELLSETGVIGLIVSMVLFLVPLFRKGDRFFHLTASSLFYYFILLGILVRVMVSSDLTESIELYSAVLAISVSKQVLSNKVVNNHL